jgi:nitrate/nitrite transport system substrate-binding protein
MLSVRSVVHSLLAVAAFGAGFATAGDAAEGFVDYQLATHQPSLKKAIENKIEKKSLKFGMIKLTDCAPIVVAKELGYFADEGLNVTIEVQPSWITVQNRVISGELDGSHMLYGHPIAATLGYGVPAVEMVAPYNISINGMGISVSNELWKQMAVKDTRLQTPGYALPVTAETIKDIAPSYKAAGEPLKFFMTFPCGSHNFNLRYWLAAGGVNPGFYDGINDIKGTTGADVLLQVNPPSLMVSAMNANNCQGFCVGEPWNMQMTLKERNGRLAIASQSIFAGSPDKVFGMTKKFTVDNPNTTRAIVRSLIRAGRWLDAAPENRKLAVEMLAHKSYIGAEVAILAESMTGTLVYNVEGGKPDRRPAADFNVFYKSYASFPLHSHAVWCLTQMRRWGMITDQTDAWYQETAAKVFRTDLYREAFASLEQEGLVQKDELPAQDSLSYPAEAFIDKIAFDPAKPNDYVAKFAIRKQ